MDLYARYPTTEVGKFSISFRGPMQYFGMNHKHLYKPTNIFTEFLKMFIKNDIIWNVSHLIFFNLN